MTSHNLSRYANDYDLPKRCEHDVWHDEPMEELCACGQKVCLLCIKPKRCETCGAVICDLCEGFIGPHEECVLCREKRAIEEQFDNLRADHKSKITRVEADISPEIEGEVRP